MTPWFSTRNLNDNVARVFPTSPTTFAFLALRFCSCGFNEVICSWKHLDLSQSVSSFVRHKNSRSASSEKVERSYPHMGKKKMHLEYDTRNLNYCKSSQICVIKNQTKFGSFNQPWFHSTIIKGFISVCFNHILYAFQYKYFLVRYLGERREAPEMKTNNLH